MKKTFKSLLVLCTIASVENAYSQASVAGNALSGTQTSPNEYLGSSSTHDVVFKTAGTEKMRMSSTSTTLGYLGINTGSFVRQLHVSTSQTNGGIRITQTGNGFSALELFNSGSGGRNYALVSTNNTNTTEGPGCFGLYDYTAGAYRMYVTPTGQVGIGPGFTVTNTPKSILHINGDFTFGPNANGQRWRLVSQALTNGKLFLAPDNAGSQDVQNTFMIDPKNHNFNFGMETGMVNIGIGRPSGIGWDNYYTTTPVHYDANMCIGFNLQNYNAAGWQTYGDGTNNGSSLIWNNSGGELAFSVLPSTGGSATVVNSSYIQAHAGMRVRWNPTTGIDHAQVVIGSKTITSGPHLDFHLSVDGKILAKEIYVTQSNWADYVFGDHYKLRSLNELEAYINANKHLPNVPTTAEITENGNNTAETDRILLEKIEELTLYIIQQNKRIEELERSVNK